MKIVVQRGVEDVYKTVGSEVCRLLSEKYGFDVAEASAYLKLSSLKVAKAPKKVAKAPKKAKKEKPSMLLPFCGVVDEEVCYGIRLSHGLHTQCQNVRVGEMDYCKTCLKHAEKGASGKPAHGDIRERLECGLLEYRDPSGKQTLPYANVMEKLGVTREGVEAEAAKFGVEIPSCHWEKRETKRGRPKKAKEEGEKAPKKRGRPKKTKEVVSTVDDDLLAGLAAAELKSEAVAAPVVEEAAPAVVEEEELVEEEEEDEKVVRFEHNGVKYLRGGDNVLYDVKSHEAVGMWNEATKSIEDVDVVSDDEE